MRSKTKKSADNLKNTQTFLFMLNQDEQNRVIKRKKSFTQEEIAAVLGLDLPEIIQNVGYKIVGNNGKNICFENPLRIENTPSFSVYLNGHLWFGKTGELVKVAT
jgi:hypothetical protein